MNIAKLIGLPCWILILSILFTDLNAQSSFDFELGGEDSTRFLVLNLLEVPNSNYLGFYGQNYYQNNTFHSTSSLLEISYSGDTSTHPFFWGGDAKFAPVDLLLINQNSNKLFIVAGHLYQDSTMEGSFEDAFWLLDSNYNTIWKKSFELSEEEPWGTFSRLMQLDDSTILYANSFFEPRGMYFFKFSTNGDSLQFREYDPDLSGKVMELTYNHDSSAYWIHTFGAHYVPGVAPCKIVQLDFDLNTTDVLDYPFFMTSYFTSAWDSKRTLYTTGRLARDGEWLITYSFDTTLDIINSDTLTHPDTNTDAASKSIDLVYNDHIYVGGTHNWAGGFNERPSWYVLGKYNNDLELQFERYIGGDANYYLFEVLATSDSGVLISGSIFDYENYNFRRTAKIIKLHPDSLLVNAESDFNIPLSDLLVYPNPASDYIFIRYGNSEANFILSNINGDVLIAKKINLGINQINIEHLNPGIYIWALTYQNKTQSGKILITN